ncbi:CU044_2847 family protein [Streptomyces phaeofaciens]|uniref:CU044_2847 family protein n=1 Tax=Streptomyces phaeofaciens TaxID=68254 RepID=UPI0036C7DF66
MPQDGYRLVRAENTGGAVAELVTMTVADGEGSVVFEAESYGSGSELELAADGGVMERAETSLRDALDRVRPALAQVTRTVRALEPDETEIQFGLKIGGESGVIVAKGTAEVNFAVRVVWKRN